MRVYRPMRWKARREVATPRLVLIVSMSPPGYSSARLRPRRAGLRFTRRFQLTNGLDPNQVPLGSRHKISSTPDLFSRPKLRGKDLNLRPLGYEPNDFKFRF